MPSPCFLATDLFHTGLVVEHLDEAMDELGRLGGYGWLPPIEHTVPVWTPDGETPVRLRMVYSRDEPLLELIEQVPGTIWMPSPGNPIHHLGYFVDDITAASRALVDAGVPLDACGTGPIRPSGFAYHTTAAGLRIELAPRSVLRDMRALLAARQAEDEPAGEAH
ncbi:hypothetical protein CC117_19270 [Parafrankia colletiae]|uniref:VOC domain-containing protein n=1 Tax=Parafrankia colletiae TaxID=573497 RepID=A0A1S1QQF0_9ACTN|nr:hypothetical protein CC117_19270 [Parafrankia colletiae]